MNENTATFANVTTTVPVTIQHVKDLLDNAFEGGSPWIDRVKRVGVKSRREGGPEYLCDVPFSTEPNASIQIECEHPTENRQALYTLDRAALGRGLALMAEKHTKHFQDMLNDNADADTGDALVQLSLFGELVFG